MYIDSHAHLTSEELLPDLAGILQRAQAASVTKIVNICTDVDNLQEGLNLRTRYPWVYTAAAVTPHDAEAEGEVFFPHVEKAASARQLIAIGETGLDRYNAPSDFAIQQRFLERHLELAVRTQLPVIFHCREAFADLFAAVGRNYSTALLHCFTGTLEEAKEVLDRGWMLSISGIVTFKKSERLRDVVRYVPLERLLIETDAPYLAPQSHRGERNEPAYLPETAAVIAAVKGMSVPDFARAMAENAERFFLFQK